MDIEAVSILIADFLAPVVLCACAVVFTFYYVKRFYIDQARDASWDSQFNRLCPPLEAELAPNKCEPLYHRCVHGKTMDETCEECVPAVKPSKRKRRR